MAKKASSLFSEALPMSNAASVAIAAPARWDGPHERGAAPGH